MQVELTKEMAIDLVMGTQPSYSLLEALDHIVQYSDQYGKYYWKKDMLEALNIEALYNLYIRIKEKV